jgi:ABC-type multidrug transport system ATPase subunit
MLLDEPFAGIDPIAVEEIMKIVTKLKERNIGVLVTDHNVHETLSITDHSYLLFEGRILKAGTGEFLAKDPEAKRLYLGEKFQLDRYRTPRVKKPTKIVKVTKVAKITKIDKKSRLPQNTKVAKKRKDG